MITPSAAPPGRAGAPAAAGPLTTEKNDAPDGVGFTEVRAWNICPTKVSDNHATNLTSALASANLRSPDGLHCSVLYRRRRPAGQAAHSSRRDEAVQRARACRHEYS